MSEPGPVFQQAQEITTNVLNDPAQIIQLRIHYAIS